MKKSLQTCASFLRFVPVLIMNTFFGAMSAHLLLNCNQSCYIRCCLGSSNAATKNVNHRKGKHLVFFSLSLLMLTGLSPIAMALRLILPLPLPFRLQAICHNFLGGVSRTSASIAHLCLHRTCTNQFPSYMSLLFFGNLLGNVPSTCTVHLPAFMLALSEVFNWRETLLLQKSLERNPTSTQIACTQEFIGILSSVEKPGFFFSLEY